MWQSVPYLFITARSLTTLCYKPLSLLQGEGWPKAGEGAIEGRGGGGIPTVLQRTCNLYVTAPRPGLSFNPPNLTPAEA